MNMQPQQHYAQAERIRANCALCGKKLVPHYDALGVLLFWTHKKKPVTND